MHTGGINAIEMEYEDIWKKLKAMSRRDRKQLAYEMTPKGFNVDNIIPHYYHEAKAIHGIEFFESHAKYPLNDDDGKYYNALKEIVENDKEIHIRVKLYAWLPRFINDWREGKIVKDYICSRINEEYVNAWYKILPGRSLAGERSRSLFITLTGGMEITYKMTECSHKNGYELLTFSRTDFL
ncbi:hypothetical protein PRLR5107_24510 [Prevotella lacticifex]|uniref:Uncharacterized protein n=2 Tax=Prevotella lacticifex TaxID=2854755 RepID=A0A9R1C7P9_9BACT|nr:hypothetical protein PRLR5003_24530 [Prevotella lacticifex]GJG40204.1 hypothetical protein PRLR5019_21750 [Prevotella lacticifex]GJG43899.1 hypothetical protein PRLR5025_26850 [Prevotella lacticifex]GJG46582.1 hypothetical protein PRLR5027_21770 [Prevotella lacticifex]GJG49667.1 hypothetical protein PRLR5052_20800 [Prevotella lacticifex]